MHKSYIAVNIRDSQCMRRDIKNISQCIQIVFFWTAGTSAENEGLALQIVESREDIQLLKESKEQALRDKKAVEKRAETAEKQLKSLEEHREQLQPIMDNVSKEIKEYGTVKMLLPEAGTLERAATYRDKKIKPLFLQIKNKVGAMAAQVKELTKEVENWKSIYVSRKGSRKAALYKDENKNC